jgi:endonuclease/exonuclease/phosphatase family metal-dependent hydrolase
MAAPGISGVKIIQANAWMGNLMSSLLTFLKQEQPDIICCQEIFSTPQSLLFFANHQIHGRLSELFAYQFFAPSLSFDVAGSEVQLGNAVYSRWPLENQRTYFTAGAYAPGQTASNLNVNIRNIQLCTIKLPGKQPLTVANHHGYWDPDPDGNEHTLASMKQAADQLASAEKPLIVCGDFNVHPGAAAMHEFDRLKLHNLTVEYGLDTTLSSASRVTRPVACDYILASDEVHVSSFKAASELVSDHKALVMEFEL